MNIIDTVIGNLRDDPWKTTLEGARIDVLTLDQWQAQKNRFRRRTEGGLELAVALERHVHLHDGDILSWDEATRTAVVARIQLQDVLVIDLKELLGRDQATLARTCFELGHALGNQHWPAVVKGTTVYVPMTVDRKVMSSVMKTHAFSGVSYGFIPGSDVIPYLAPHEARRLFGGADATPHSHHAGQPHAHAHSQADAAHIHGEAEAATPDRDPSHPHPHPHPHPH